MSLLLCYRQHALLVLSLLVCIVAPAGADPAGGGAQTAPPAAVTGPVGPPAASAPTYRITDVGILPGFVESVPTGINAAGDVVGYCDRAASRRAGREAFLYHAGKLHPIAAPTQLPDWSEAHAVNAGDVVVGDLGTVHMRSGFRSAAGVLVKPIVGAPGLGGTVVHLIQLKPYYIDTPNPGGYIVTAGHINAVNDAGVMAGVVQVDTTIKLANGHTANISIVHAGIVRAASAGGYTFTDLGALGGKISQAYAINEAGAITGSAELGANAIGFILPHACVFENGKVTDLGTLGGSTSVGFDINSHGDVVGDATNKAETARAFLWRGGVMTDLGDLGGGLSEALGVNDSDVVVGRSFDRAYTQYGYVCADGVMSRLDDLVPRGSGWEITDAVAINNRGQIAAIGVAGGHKHALLLTPL